MTIRRRKPGQRGNTMLELAICMPAFLLLTMGAMDFSWGVYAYNFCAYAAQDAARAASFHGSKATSPNTIWGAADVTSFVQSETVGLSASQMTVTTCWSSDCMTTGSPASGENDPGDTVKVTVAYTLNPLTGFGFSHSFNVAGTAQYVINH